MKNKNNHELLFYITGFIFMFLIAGLKYYAQSEVTFASLIISWLFGGAVGLLAVSPKDSFIKNVVFIATFTWLIWAFLNPISIVGNTWIVKSTELLAIITIFIIFLEKEFWNSFKRMHNKPAKFGIGFVGSIFLAFLISKLGIFRFLGDLLSKHWLFWVGFVLLWVLLVFFLLSRSLSKIAKRIRK